MGVTGGSEPRSIAPHRSPKKKAVLEVSRGKCVLVSNTSDDNESMGKLFASNLKVAVDEMAESISYANKLAENIAEVGAVKSLKIAVLKRVECSSRPLIGHIDSESWLTGCSMSTLPSCE